MKITIEAEKITEKYILQQHVGAGEYDERPLSLSTALPEMSPIVEYRGERYRVNIHALARAVCEAVDAEAERSDR